MNGIIILAQELIRVIMKTKIKNIYVVAVDENIKYFNL